MPWAIDAAAAQGAMAGYAPGADAAGPTDPAPAPPPQTDSGDAFDEGAPVGPSETEESAFLAEQRSAPAFDVGLPVRTAEKPERDEEASAPLPPLDELVQRVPAQVREQMDELFRAKFVTVRRMPRSAFKS